MSEPLKTSGSDQPATRLPRQPVREFSTTFDPDHAPLHRLDPVLKRTGQNRAKGVLLVAIAGLLFLMYAFNLGGAQIYLDKLFDDVNRAAQSKSNVVASTVITIAPFVAAALIGLLLYGLVKWLTGGVKQVSKNRRLARRKDVTLSEFVKLVAPEGVGPKVAREGYGLLLPHYGKRMRVRLDDTLRGDLHLNDHAQMELYAALLANSDRHARGIEKQAVPATVLALLLAAQNAPVRAAAKEPDRMKTGQITRSVIRPIARRID